jgi:hypothetical protein
LERKTPKNLAPNLFKKTRRKKLSVYQALQDNKWITHILPLQTQQEIQEYVALWEQIRDIQLNANSEDTIRWKWTNRFQFEGSYSKLKLTPIWRAKVEPKCHFFAWTLLHKKKYSLPTT